MCATVVALLCAVTAVVVHLNRLARGSILLVVSVGLLIDLWQRLQQT